MESNSRPRALERLAVENPDTRSSGSRREKIIARGALAGLALLAALFWWQTLGRPWTLGILDDPKYLFDFRHYLESSRTLWAGGDPYERDSPTPFAKNPLPLFLPWAALPFAWPPFILAGHLWLFLNAAALAGSLAIPARWLRETLPGVSGARLAGMALLTALMFFSPIRNNIRNGQVNPIVLFAMVCAADQLARGREPRAALALGAAIAVKLIPAVALAWFVPRGRWRGLILSAAAAIVLCVAPAAVLGFKLFDLYYVYLADFLLGGGLNIEGFAPYRIQTGADNLIAPLLPAGVPAFPFSPLPLIALVWMDGLTLKRNNDPKGDRYRFLLYPAAGLLAMPFAEKHHLILAMPAAYVYLCAARNPWPALAGFAALFALGALFPAFPYYPAALLALLSVGLLESRNPSGAPQPDIE